MAVFSNSQASPGTKGLTAQQTEHEKVERIQYVSVYILCPRIELEDSRQEEQRRRHSGRPRAAPSTIVYAEGQSRKQDSDPNDKCDVTGCELL